MTLTNPSHPRLARIDPTLTPEEHKEAWRCLLSLSIQIVQHAPPSELCFLIVCSENVQDALKLAVHYTRFRIVGIDCLRYCARKKIDLPVRNAPTLNCKLKGFRIKMLGMNSESKMQICSLVESMDGNIAYDHNVTHLVVEKLDTEACKAAICDLSYGKRIVKIVKPQWLNDCWQYRINKLPCESKYCHGCPIFKGFFFCFQGFGRRKRSELMKLATLFGAEVSCDPRSRWTHIIQKDVNNGSREHFHGYLQNGVVLTENWLVESCSRYSCSPVHLISSRVDDEHTSLRMTKADGKVTNKNQAIHCN
jgi:hypothetical protein